MKKLIVCVLFGLILGTLLTESANGQWYKRRYGVESINELTPVQIDQATKTANYGNIIGAYTTSSGLGCIAIGGVVRMLGRKHDQSQPYSGGLFSQGYWIQLYGTFAMILGIPFVTLGLPIWIIGSDRKSKINKAFNSGTPRISISPNVTWIQQSGYLGARIIIPINCIN